MKIYIAGGMTGATNLNFSAFDAAKERLQKLGFEVISPADLERNRSLPTYEAKLRDDLYHLLGCEAIYLLVGWEYSKGARMEYHVAKTLGFIVMYQ